MQKLTGMASALNRFISRSADRCRPFFLLINKRKNFEWTEECAKAFQQLKDYLARPPIMSSPEPDEVLFAYIAVAPYALSLVLIRVDNGIHQPGGILNPLSSPWPFAQWGLDIVGPFPKAVGNKKYLLVGIDYFTKWVEVEPLANIRDVDVKRFVWKNIVTRFGVPHVLISDNGLQFDSKIFRKYCGELGITNRYSTPAYPQGKGQAEAVNKVIISGLKKRLDDAKGKWVEELPHVL